MDLQLIPAAETDAQSMLNMQKMCFKKHFERYQDHSGSPYTEVLEKMIFRINYEKGSYYKIVCSSMLIGGLWVFEKEAKIYRIGIIYIIPEYQSKGVGQKALAMAENLHPNAAGWELDCPEDLIINCRCYEKAGYTLTGEKEIINEKLTLINYRKETKS